MSKAFERYRRPRKFYSIRTKVYEQLFDEPNKDLDYCLDSRKSRGMAELIARLLTEHFEKEFDRMEDDRGGEEEDLERCPYCDYLIIAASAWSGPEPACQPGILCPNCEKFIPDEEGGVLQNLIL